MRYSRINRCANGCSVFHSSPDAAHTLSLRQPSVDHRPGAGYRLPRHLHASGQEGRLFEKDSPHWCGNADSAIRSVRRLYALRVPAALNLNIHFHMLFLDGVYVDRLDGSVRFRWVSSPTTQELTQLSQTIARRVGRYLERQGLLERDADDCMDAAVRRPGGRATNGAVAENSYLTTDAVPEDLMNQILGHSMM